MNPLGEAGCECVMLGEGGVGIGEGGPWNRQLWWEGLVSREMWSLRKKISFAMLIRVSAEALAVSAVWKRTLVRSSLSTRRDLMYSFVVS